jgi:hypothetical protein
MPSIDSVRIRLASAGIKDIDSLPISVAEALDSLSDEEMKALGAAQAAIASSDSIDIGDIIGGYIF